MPIYEYECKDGHRLERILSLREATSVVICMTGDCRNEARRVPSLCTMKPDAHWNGTILPNGKLVTNSKEYNDATANWETISDSSQAYTKQRKRIKEKETKQKIEKQVESYLQSELAGVSL